MVWNRLAYGYAAIVAAATAYLLIHVPFEVSDNLLNLLRLQASESTWSMAVTVFTASSMNDGFLRPLSWVSTMLVFDLSGGHYFVAYRSLTIAMVCLLLALFVRLLRIDSLPSLLAAVLAVGALVGLHTFHQTVRETELNIKLIIPVVCFAAVNLTVSRPAWWKDALAIALICYGVLANELGLLVWTAVVAAYVVGFRGVSRQAVMGGTVVLCMYLFLRFVWWDAGTPALTERSSGFGFAILDPPELVALFDDRRYLFYAYNVMASALGILLSEPSSGAFLFTRHLLAGEATSAEMVKVATSAATTAVMIWFVIRRWRIWVSRDTTYADRLFLVFIAVWAGNAAISFPYVKDISLSTGGAFYALGTFVALRFLVAELWDRRVTALRAAGVCALLAVLSVGWTLRTLSFFADMDRAAYTAKADWHTVYDWLDEQNVVLENDQQRRLVEALRIQMTTMPPPSLPLPPAF